jgi:hypothetical protein
MINMAIEIIAIKYGVKNKRGFRHVDRNSNNLPVLTRQIFEPETFQEEAEVRKIYKKFNPHPKTFTYF